MSLFNYLLISSLCLSLAYGFYRLLYRKAASFKHLRLFLISAILLSLILPLSEYSLNIQGSLNETKITSTQEEEHTETTTKNSEAAEIPIPITRHSTISIQPQSNTNWLEIIKMVYLLVAFSLLTRLAIRIVMLCIHYLRSERVPIDKTTLVINTKYKNIFSFFGWIFFNPEITQQEDRNQIISHEKVHASQYHSLDLLLIELVAAAMWFNPVVWMMRNSIQLVHEYLADEGALESGIDKYQYQALLINQVSEGRLICLSSNFSSVGQSGRQSLIKKRMIMMNKNVNNTGTKLKILALIPVAAILFFTVACVNKPKDKEVMTAIAAVKMNVMYLGVNNPVNIAVSGYDASEIEVTVENGNIEGENGEYIVKPSQPGTLKVSVSAKGKVIRESVFRVKTVPNPRAAFKIDNEFRSSGRISKSDILAAGEPIAFMENFDFDLNFTISSFILSAQLPGKFIVREEISKDGKLSPLQVDLLNSLVVNQKLMVEEIVATGPDGAKRKLSPMVLTISEE